MNAADARVYRRPDFNVSGRVVCRRALKLNGVDYAVGEEMPSFVELGLSHWEALRLWRTLFVDTLPHEKKPKK